MKKIVRCFSVGLVAFCLLCAPTTGFAADAETVPVAVPTLPKTLELLKFYDYGVLEQRARTLENGDVFTENRISFNNADKKYMSFPIFIPGSTIAGTYYDYVKNKWFDFDPVGSLPSTTVYLTTDKGSAIVSSPSSFTPSLHECLEENRFYTLPSSCEKVSGGFVIRMTFLPKDGTQGQFWWLWSEHELTPKSKLTAADSIWSICGNTSIHHWTYNGYYYRMPNAYSPWTPNTFWKCPGVFTAKRFLSPDNGRGSDDFAIIVMDTVVKDQDDAGYWLSSPPNTAWLEKDYGIGADFYDTRFNADTTLNLLNAYKSTGIAEFLTAAIKHCDFFIDFAAKHNHSFKVGDATGILVEDYTWPGHEYKKVHTALNHQLAEMLMLYNAYELTGEQKYMDTAEQMLLGIQAVGEKWIKSDGSLEYAYMADGTMGLVDYPTLTYDDLFKFQQKRESMGMQRDPFLQTLMNSKLNHMIKNNITDYLK